MKNKQILVIPFNLPELNETLHLAKTHWSKYAAMKKQYTHAIAILAKQKLRPVQGPISITFHWYYRNKRRDPDNISSSGRKLILDGLVTSGILADDGWNHISGFQDSFHIDKQNSHVEIEISEVKA